MGDHPLAGRTVTGTVFNVQRFAIQDGPGVRTTVFLKSCPLRCLWCHNPEGLAGGPQVLHFEGRCDGCGDCLAACPDAALALAGRTVRVDHARCTRCVRCGLCVSACAAGALQLVGRPVSVAQLMAELERDRVFYDQSGGGVTFSGGEPLAQPAFLLAALAACREREIHTVLDTSGYAAGDLLAAAAALAGLVLFDLKAVDEQRHRELTGVSNDGILDNLRRLVSAGRQVLLRIPVIPGCNDDADNLDQLAGLVGSLAPRPAVNLLPYHATAEEKYRRLGQTYPLAGVRPPSAARMAEIAQRLSGHGLAVTIGG